MAGESQSTKVPSSLENKVKIILEYIRFFIRQGYNVAEIKKTTEYPKKPQIYSYVGHIQRESSCISTYILYCPELSAVRISPDGLSG
jgi:hypothetical protein